LRPRTFIGAGCVALLLAPALAIGQAPGITAVDTPAPAWQGTPLTVTAGATVTFSYSGTKQHYVEFAKDGPQPSCTPGVPMAFKTGSWSGECTFPTAGQYDFICPLHDIPPIGTMRGTIRVVEPTPTPTPATLPDAVPTPAPTTAPTVDTQTSLTLTLASRQRGKRVRGQVAVLQAGSRLVVTLRVRRVRVGRVVQSSTRAGTVRFSVPLDAKAKRVLRTRKRLDVTVAVALTPPGARTITRTQKVRLRR
jgi:plastocyanin